MIGRRAVIGLSLLCALAFSALTASGAMAESKTTTAFTCVKKVEKGGAGFSKAHCKAEDAVASNAEYEHVEISPLSWTTFDATNANTTADTSGPTEAVLTSKVGGLTTIIKAKTVTATGELENFTATPGSGPMDIKGRHITIHFSELTLSGNITTVCTLVNTTITTNELESTSLVNTMEAEYKPEVGEEYTSISLNCPSSPGLTGIYPIVGSSKAIGDGATTETTAASTAGLKLGGKTGQAATFTSKLTPRMTTGTTTENAIGATTIVDP